MSLECDALITLLLKTESSSWRPLNHSAEKRRSSFNFLDEKTAPEQLCVTYLSQYKLGLRTVRNWLTEIRIDFRWENCESCQSRPGQSRISLREYPLYRIPLGKSGSGYSLYRIPLGKSGSGYPFYRIPLRKSGSGYPLYRIPFGKSGSLYPVYRIPLGKSGSGYPLYRAM